MSSWYSMKALGSQRAAIYLYGDIVSDRWFDEEVSASSFRKSLADLGDVTEIDLHINSRGGNVFQAEAIYSMIKQHPAKVIGYVDGLAASAATLPLAAADEVYISTVGQIMIHNPWGIAIGEADDMRKQADVQDQIRASWVSAYGNRVALTEDELTAAMDAETWYSAEDAVALGWADGIIPAMQIAACGDLSIFGKVPKMLNRKPAPPKPADPAIIADRFAEADAGQYVSALLRRKPTEADVSAEMDRIKGVRDICAAASLDPDPYIRAGLNPEQVSLVATEIKAAVESHIDTHQPPPDNKPAFSTAKVYAARRQISVIR